MALLFVLKSKQSLKVFTILSIVFLVPMCGVKALSVYIVLGRALNITDADLKYVKKLIRFGHYDAEGEERLQGEEDDDKIPVSMDISGEKGLMSLENYYDETHDVISQSNPLQLTQSSEESSRQEHEATA